MTPQRRVRWIRRFRPHLSFAPVTAPPYHGATVLLILIGAALRVWQYLANSSLWVDEAALARNIIERPMTALFGGLDYAQVAPPGFLLIQKAMVAALGSSEYALRLFPLLCGIGGLVIFARLAGNILEGWAAPFAVGLFALGSPFVFFSSQAKQYSSDTAASLLVTSAAIWMQRHPDHIRRGVVLGTIGACVVWVSQPAFFVVAGVGASMAAVALLDRQRSRLGPLLTVEIMWGFSLIVAAVIALRTVSPMDRSYLDWYWEGGFWPIPPRSRADLLWPWHQLTWAFGAFGSGPRRTNGGLNYPWSPVFLVIMLVGYVALWKRRRNVALALAAPALLALAASAFQLYPFTGRLVVFLTPSFLLATAAGAHSLLAAWPKRLEFATPALLAVLGGAPVYAAITALPPERIEHIRPIVASIATRRERDDAVYVYYGAGQAWLYYAPRFGLATSDVTVGRCSAGDPRAYLRELDRFRGRPRLWVVATHLIRGTAELELLNAYLDAMGRRLDSIVISATTDAPRQGAYAFLYDLSELGRLVAVSSETFPVSAPDGTSFPGRWTCYGTQSPLAVF